MASERSFRAVASETLFAGQPRFTVENMPDMTGRVALITGGSSGCGLAIARGLLLHNARVYIAARNKTKALDAIASLREQLNPNIQVEFLQLDLADLASIRNTVAAFHARESRLDCLINNAGVFLRERQTTKDGHEAQFGINVIGAYVLTELLLDTLKKTARADESKFAVKTGVRILFTSSSLMHVAPKELIPLNDMPSLSTTKYSPEELFAISKAADCTLACYYNRVLKEDKIISVAISPGLIRTDLLRDFADTSVKSILMSIIGKFVLQNQSYGAINSLYALWSPEIKGGEYIVCWCRTSKPRVQVLDEEFQDELVAYCREEAFKFKAL